MKSSNRSIFIIVLAVLLIVGFVIGMTIACIKDPSISDSPWLYGSAAVTFLIAIVMAIIGFSGLSFDIKDNTKRIGR